MRGLEAAVMALMAWSFIGAAAGPDLPVDRAVRRDFMKLKQALEKGEGAEAAALASRGTLEQYEAARKLAIGGGGTDLETLPQMQVLMILQFRYLADRETLEKMKDGAGAFAWGVEQGLLKKETVAAFALREVEADGDHATAKLTRSGKPVNDLAFHFETNSAGRWALQFEKVMEAAEPQLAKVREEAKKSKVEFALYLMEKTYGKPMPPEILEGPIK